MSYEVTATRKRPQSFAELVGQEFVAATLSSSLRQGRIAHAYLFAGPRGVGKTSVARILARALNCDKGPTDTPCGVCPSCQEIARGSSLDVIEIDGASNTSVNDVREIRDEVLFAPNAGRFKVYIIDEVHMLSNSAFNALLKTIEEPPPYIVFIFATTEVHKVPATIRSRCQQYNFRLISTGEIKEKLREASRELGVDAEERALIWIAKEATGSLRDAYTLLDQVVSFSEGAITFERIREKLGVLGIDELNEFARLLRTAGAGKVLERMDSILAERRLHRTVRGQPGRIFPQPAVPEERDHARHPPGLRGGGLRQGRAGVTERGADRESHRASPRPVQQHTIFPEPALRARAAALPTGPARQDDRSRRSTRTPCGRCGESFSPPPGAQTAAPSLQEQGSREETAVDPGQSLKNVVEALRREKPALASALDKVSAVTLEGEELVLSFSAKERFQGDVVLKDKDTLAARLAALLSRPVRIKLAFHEVKTEPVESRPEGGAAAEGFSRRGGER